MNFRSASDLAAPDMPAASSGEPGVMHILGFMIERAGNANWKLYDGSWHEWGQREDTPKLVVARTDA